MSGIIAAIDPGNIESGFAVIDADTYRPLRFGKVPNGELIEEMGLAYTPCPVMVEMVASYGMSVGQTVFDTCVWIGRFWEACEQLGCEVSFVKRKEYVTDLCGSAKAKDANVIQYLIDRFAPNTPNRGKGTKKTPGWFYGFKADMWQAYAIAVWALDQRRMCSKGIWEANRKI